MTDGETATVVVPTDLDGARADRVVAVALGMPRSRARRLFDHGLVTVGGEAASPAQRLPAGVELTVTDAAPEGGVAPEPVPFEVVHEDRHLVVVDKPAGVVVHPGAGITTGTLVSGLLARFPDLARLEDRRFGLVHRLDRDTSGLLLVARDAEVLDALQGMLRRREVSRTYLALVAGDPPAATGTIDAPIGRHPTQPTRMAVDPRGRAARTRYRRLAAWPGAALLEVSLESGRTHQIRVHLAAVDLPVIGDRAYGRRRATVTAGDEPPAPGRRHLADPGRQWLHATRLQLDHPVTGKVLTVGSAIPADLADALDRLGEPRTGRVPPGARRPHRAGGAGPGR